jgi:hypothetical protein
MNEIRIHLTRENDGACRVDMTCKDREWSRVASTAHTAAALRAYARAKSNRDINESSMSHTMGLEDAQFEALNAEVQEAYRRDRGYRYLQRRSRD